MMPDSKVQRFPALGSLPILILSASCLLNAAPNLANTPQPPRTTSVMTWPDNPYTLYQTIGQTFWNAEHQLQERVNPFSAKLSPYKSPLSKSDPLYQKYFQVEQMADKYIHFLDANKDQSWTLPPTLYLGGIAAFTIGDYASAKKYFSRLLEDYPGYKRYSYIGDNYTPDPDFAQPAKPGITKLLFYCQLAVAYGKAPNPALPRSAGIRSSGIRSSGIRGSGIRGSGVPPVKTISSSSTGETPEPRAKPIDPFTAFQQFNKTSQKVLLSQVTFAHWLANRPYRSQRRNFFNEYYGDQPDQRRASTLPKTTKLIETGWQNLFAATLKKSGALEVRKYLRTLTSEDASLRDIAATHLAEVDQLVIKHYFAQAKVLLGKKDFAATRKKYKQIIAEYPDSDASRRAEAELPKLVPIVVNYYQKIADDNFHPAAKIGVPQNKAATYYEKMFHEDETGPKADQALYYWARALGTAGKVKEEVKLLQQHLNTFPQSTMRAQAMYLLGFTYLNHGLRDSKRGIPLLLQVAAEFPQDPLAAESLWNAAFVLGWNKQYQQAIPLLQQLKKQHPKSPRAKWADEWIAKYKEGV